MGMSPRLLRPRASGDPDALRYIAAVQLADGQSLEPAVKKAINDFVVGCKRDGIFGAMKACCILAGARTLSGALTPLVGSAPTNNNFVSSDYNRKTGLVGNGTTKYLDSNRNNTADPQNNKHVAIYTTSLQNNGMLICGAGTTAGRTSITQFGSFTSSRVNCAAVATLTPNISTPIFLGASRSSSASYTSRAGTTSQTINDASDGSLNENIGIFGRVDNTLHSNTRIAFYSIGEALDIASLQARVTTLVTAIGAAIP